MDDASPLDEATRAGRTLPHVAALLQSAKRIAPPEGLGLLPVALLDAAGMAHRRRGEYAAGVVIGRALLREARAARGDEHLDTLGSMSNLATALHSMGQYEEAAAMQRTALEAMQRVLGDEHPDTLASMNNLAVALRDAGQHEEAAAMHQTALEAQRRVL